MSKFLSSRLGSLKLTLWLLLAIAAVAAFGTFAPIPQGLEKIRYQELYPTLGGAITGLGLDRFHSSIPFRALVSVLIVNLLACALEKSLKGFRNAFARGEPSAVFPMADRERSLADLRARGFAIRSEAPLFATKRAYAFSAFSLVHLAPLVVVVGMLWGSLGGVVATSNIHVGAIESKFMDWDHKEQRDLPFAVKPESFRREYYQLELQLRLFTQGGPDLGEVTVSEGESFTVPGTDLQMIVDRFDPDANDIAFRVFDGSRRVGSFTRASMPSSPVRIQPLAWRGEVRSAVASLAFFDITGAKVGGGVASVNNPVEVLGHRVFLTAWGDDGGEPFVGLQVSRDPGQPLVWAGSVIFVIGLFLLLFAEGAWVREEEGALAARSTRGRRALAWLEEGE